MFPSIRWRIAISYLILVAVVMGGLAAYLLRPGCSASTTCVRQTVSIASVVLLVGTAMLAFPLAARTTHPVKQLVEVMRRTAAGDWEARILPQTRDEVGELIFAFNEMIERLKQQHLAMLEENVQFTTVLNYMVDGVLITDNEGKVRLINRAAAKIFNHSAESA